MEVILKTGERIDDLQRNGLRIIQNKDVFSFTMDSVLLSSFVSLATGDTVVDLGTGTGVLPLLLVGRKDLRNVVGVEIQDLLADMAQRSVQLNAIKNIEIIRGDLKDAPKVLGHEAFDVVVSNPPYMSGNRGKTNSLDTKTIARHEICCNLEDVIKTSSKLVRYGGKVAFVHRPERIVDICFYMRLYNIEPKRLQLVQPKANKEPNVLLIEGIKGGKPGLITSTTLMIYDEDGQYTPETMDIYYK